MKRDGLLKIPWLVAIDILLIGAGLVIFAYFHHVRAVPEQVVTSATPRPTVAASEDTAQTQSPAEATPTPTEAAELTWREKFADMFLAEGDPILTDTSYQSQDISIQVDMYAQDGVVYFVQDIYIADISCISAALADDTYGRGVRDNPLNIAIDHDAICAITGDYYGARSDGIVVRNGVLYRDTEYGDTCVLYYDGTMKTFAEGTMDVQAEMEAGAYQIWSFGPLLLTDDGQPITEFNSRISRANPRACIGYIEPGHYVFIVVDGRDEGYSVGMTLAELSQLAYDLGCVAAYNLDGGQTAQMFFNGELVNQPTEGGRSVSDIIMIAETGASD